MSHMVVYIWLLPFQNLMTKTADGIHSCDLMYSIVPNMRHSKGSSFSSAPGYMLSNNLKHLEGMSGFHLLIFWQPTIHPSIFQGDIFVFQNYLLPYSALCKYD